MMAWKLATNPVRAINDSKTDPMPSPKIVSNARISGSSDSPTAAAPGAMPELSVSVRKDATMRASIPHMMALGMSRCGLRDSSAASGTCSMARKNQIANGRA